MAVPNLVPLLGSIAGTLAGPELAQRAATALGIADTPAGRLVADASPKAIGAGIATLRAGAEVDDAMKQVLKITQNEMDTAARQFVSGAMPPVAPPPMGGMVPQAMPQGMPQGMVPQGMVPQGMVPQGMVPQGMPQGMPQQPQPTMYNAFPQVQPPQSLGTGLGTLRPEQRQPMSSMTKGLV